MTLYARPLNLEAVAAFVLASDFQSFTRAAEALGTTQAAVSLHVKRLEVRLGRRLLDRTPRLVRLSADGAAFIPQARELLRAHAAALASLETVPAARLRIGISEQVAGPELPRLLVQVRAHDPTLVLEVRLAFSRDLLDAFARRDLDVAIVRDESSRRAGSSLLLQDELGWYAAETWTASTPLPLATLAQDCGVRSLATSLLDAATIPWTEVFIGGGLAAAAAAVTAGLAVSPLPRRLAPRGATDVGPRLGLPPLPASSVVLLSHATEKRGAGAVRTLVTFFRSEARRRQGH